MKKIDFVYKMYMISFYLFVFCSVSNASIVYELNLIGKFGKLIIPILMILLSFFFNLKIRLSKYLFFMIFLFLLGSFIFALEKNSFSMFYLKGSFLFSIYIIYYSLIVKISFLKYKKLAIYYIFYIVLLALIFSIIVNFLFSILIGKNIMDMMDTDSIRVGFGGFYKDRMLFSLLMYALFIITFVIFNLTRKKHYIFLLILSIIFIFFTNTRTSLYGIFLFISLYVFFSFGNKNKYFYVIFLIMNIIMIMLIFQFNINYFTNNYINIVNKITSGRFFIWSLVYEYLFNKNYIINGLFNLNNVILKENKFLSYYFEKIDYLNFHNSYLEMISGGSVIIIIFLIFLLKNIRLANVELKSILLSILFMAMFEGFLVEPHKIISMLFWISIIYLYFLNLNRRSKIE